MSITNNFEDLLSRFEDVQYVRGYSELKFQTEIKNEELTKYILPY
jgi:hypothetical protein